MTALAVNFAEGILNKEINLILGTVCKIISNKITVYSNEEFFECSPRGVLKIKSQGIKVGDKVEFENGLITSIKKRISFFPRTNVANIEVCNIVIAPLPKPDFLLVDKMIVEARHGGAEVWITVNKNDTENSAELYNYVCENYCNCVEKIFLISAKNGFGVEELKKNCKNKICVFAGQSAVGKTSLVNVLFGIQEKTNEISQKTLRGRHTTTKRQIHFIDEYSIVDTPGFSAVDINLIKSQEISKYYKDFEEFNGKCYYIGCVHVNEPDCLVKEAVENKQISFDRYQRYLTIYKEVKEYEKMRKY